jgi:hypothetical protein
MELLPLPFGCQIKNDEEGYVVVIQVALLASYIPARRASSVPDSVTAIGVTAHEGMKPCEHLFA